MYIITFKPIKTFLLFRAREREREIFPRRRFSRFSFGRLDGRSDVGVACMVLPKRVCTTYQMRNARRLDEQKHTRCYRKCFLLLLFVVFKCNTTTGFATF